MSHAIDLDAAARYAKEPGFFARLRQSFADHRRYLAVHKELNTLSDRQLADIGLSRLNLREISRAAVDVR